MLVKKENRIKRKLKKWAWKLFSRLEYIDNGGSDINMNGEANFIDQMFGFYSDYLGMVKSSRLGIAPGLSFPEYLLINPVKLLYSRPILNESLLILDIGANQGDYSKMLLAFAAQHQIPVKIHLFEPLHECFIKLQSNFPDKSNLFLNNFGISESDTNATLFYNQEMSPLASVYQRKVEQYNISLNKSQQVNLKRMDHYIQDQSIEHIHFVKLDVEGHELSALHGFGDYLNASFVDFIQFEYGETYFDAHIRLLEVYQLLENRGFKIAKITPSGLVLKRYYPYMENFMYANYVAISSQILASN